MGHIAGTKPWKPKLGKSVLTRPTFLMIIVTINQNLLYFILQKCESNVHINELPSLIERVCNDCFTKLRKETHTAVVYSFSILVTRCIVFWMHELKGIQAIDNEASYGFNAQHTAIIIFYVKSSLISLLLYLYTRQLQIEIFSTKPQNKVGIIC